jgi:hypothetical protein
MPGIAVAADGIGLQTGIGVSDLREQGPPAAARSSGTARHRDPAMIDVLVVCLALGTWLALGYPVARKLGPSVNWPALAAAPLGLAILGALTVILYVSGLRIETVFKVCIGLAIPGIALAVRDGLRSPLDRSHGAFLVTLAIATLLVLLPKWLAPPDFTVFQANFGDQFFFLSQAWNAPHYDYPTIRDMDRDVDLETQIARGFPQLTFLMTARPGAALILAGFASTLGQPILTTSYAYLGALQLCIFFSALFVLRNVIALSNGLSLFLALGVTVGFFLQYAFDVNAWSSLASLSLLTLYVGLLILGLATKGPGETMGRIVLTEAGLLASMLICMAGFWYIYPEIWSMVMAISAPIVAYQFFVSADRGYFLRQLLLTVLAAGGAIALCTLAWPMTVGFILRQTAVVQDPSRYFWSAAWFQRYLFGFDIDWNAAFDFVVIWHQSVLVSLYHVLSIVASFLAGILGVYFLQPDTNVPIGLRIVWKLGLLGVLVGLLGFWLWGLLRAAGEPRQQRNRVLFVGVLGGLTLVAGLRWMGQYYPTGKALTWLCPILILALIGHLLADKRIPRVMRFAALSYIAIQICFGGYRSYAAAHGVNGVHYHFPYPVDVSLKYPYRWDYSGLQAALRGCSRVIVDLDDPYHEIFVKMALIDRGIRWWSLHPIWGSGRDREQIEKQIDNSNCTVTTQARSIGSSHTVIWLRRDDRVLRFYRGETNRLVLVPNLPLGLKSEVVPNLPLGLDSEGFMADGVPTVGKVWTNGHAVVRVPNNPSASIKRLTLALDSEPLPADIRVAVLINGRRVLDDVASPGSDWIRNVELPDLGKEASLNIEIDSDTHVARGPARVLGARLRLLSLER